MLVATESQMRLLISDFYHAASMQGDLSHERIVRSSVKRVNCKWVI